ncbi:methylated-DNA--protein-cysteine methyltransferase isoform X2 [Protopterus annectens]|uniref:methylated-DNA--protein-cysteine methyltransferase isoform X2 n=1 Tax=Protopterus annectens TaxID=7888 RepID=UPI001CFA1998|nr:methylated-DNA--protein-cysteine methyltransferase isoform X2 [Protopterus annectens]XP_043912248.1 methylated-DNA--protein-cysteine methyltransferase isoform X2 [Protopterus annectens]XP_043912249.1 methylated-DNA--protein-cysteine methyltransferase isoform X2 [Protopterus annectens]XP_043912250.1 methylated-DNA--protein-cysteine methyltransferase isoform X2 [Protopterus annectens]
MAELRRSAYRMDADSCKLVKATLKSPVGKIDIVGCEKGIHEIHLQEDAVPGKRTKEASFTCEVCEGLEEMTPMLEQCAAWLHAYFCKPQVIETLPIPSFHHPVFQQATFTSQVLWTLLKNVKFGERVSYKYLADLAGNSKAARAVGGAMRSNPVPVIVPCHRVVCSDGQIGSYMGGKNCHLKQWLLTHEKLIKEEK